MAHVSGSQSNTINVKIGKTGLCVGSRSIIELRDGKDGRRSMEEIGTE